MRQFLWVCALTAMLAGVSFADITIVDDNFDSYANDAAFEAVWVPTDGTGLAPPIASTGPIGLLVPRTVSPFPPAPYDGSADPTTMPPIPPVDDPLTPEVEKAVAFSTAGNINEWDNDGDRTNDPFLPILGKPLLPSASDSIRVAADMFTGGGDFDEVTVDSVRRMTVGLRNDLAERAPDAFGLNFLELGYYNATTCDPTSDTCPDPNNPDPLDPSFRDSTSFGYRVQLFGGVSDPLLVQPNWQYFDLPIEFDDPLVDHNMDGRVGNGDGIVDENDVGPSWNRFMATITDTEITLELDLFRDGEIDASQTWGVFLANDPATGEPAPFTSLRIGGPSGISINSFSMVDNVKLELLEEVVTGPDGDFNGDGFWDCLDIDALVTEIVAGTDDPAFDMNGDGFVNGDDITDANVGWLAVGGSQNPADTNGNPFLEGDANLDGSVDVSDFNSWNGNKFTALPEWCAGDFNADGSIDVSDFNTWNGNKFQSSAGAAVVPEPTSALLIAVCGMLLTWWQRRAYW